ncbi:MAG: polysaccharide deacetylase [Lachnospiraceae bacterium]|nr:polysaccharide deacetylase [Lachnospiraceae bacterium]
MENTEERSLKRKKRVKRIRKIIFVGFPVTILVLFVICLILIARIGTLKKALAGVRDELNFYLEAQSEREFAENIAAGVVSNAEGVTALASQPETEDNTASGEMASEKMSDEEVESLLLGDEELYDGFRRVYLTFDDGPSVNTGQILDILKEYNVKATFFVIRKDGRNNEKLYRRIVDEGHTLGMHSNTHEYSVVYKSEEAFKEDTVSLQDFLYLVTGEESKYYRFPGGSSNRVSHIDMKVFASELHDMGIEYYDWNVSAGDAVIPRPDSGTVYSNVISGILNHESSIVLLHDTASKKSTVAALPKIIEYLQSLDDTVILPITDGTRPIQHLTTD